MDKEELKKEGFRSIKEFDMAWEEFFKNKPEPKNEEEDKNQQEGFYYWYNYVRKQSDTGKTPAEMYKEIYGEDPKEIFDEKRPSRFINFDWDEDYEEDFEDDDEEDEEELDELTNLADMMFESGVWQNSKEEMKEMSKRDSSRHMFRMGVFMHHKYMSKQMKDITNKLKGMSEEDAKQFLKTFEEDKENKKDINNLS